MVYTKNVRVPFDCILPAIAFFCGFFDKWPRCGWSLSKSILFLALIANSWARQVVAISVFIMRCAQSIADNQFSLGNSFSLGCRLSIVDLSFDFLASLVPHFCASSSVGAMGAKAPSKDKDYTTWIARATRRAPATICRGCDCICTAATSSARRRGVLLLQAFLQRGKKPVFFYK